MYIDVIVLVHVFMIASLMHCIIMFIFSIKSYYVNLIIKYLQIYAQRWNHQVHNSLAVIIVTA